ASPQSHRPAACSHESSLVNRPGVRQGHAEPGAIHSRSTVEASPYYRMADRTAWMHPAVRTSTEWDLWEYVALLQQLADMLAWPQRQSDRRSSRRAAVWAVEVFPVCGGGGGREQHDRVLCVHGRLLCVPRSD